MQNSLHTYAFNITANQTVTSTPIQLDETETLVVHVHHGANASNTTFAAADVNVSDDTATIANHGYRTGTAITLTTSGSLPTGLSLATTYYLIVVDANTVKFAASLVNANAGTAINITAQGSGTNTVNVASKSASLQRQISCDGTRWVNDGSADAISGAATTSINPLTGVSVNSQQIRWVLTVTTGQFPFEVLLHGKSTT